MKRFFYAIVAAAVIALSIGLFVSLNSRVEKTEHLGGYTEKYYFFKKLVGERTYLGDLLEGRTATYHGNGNVKSEWTYLKGKKQGLAKQYTLDGNLRYEDDYIEDRRVSRKEYDDRGNVVKHSGA